MTFYGNPNAKITAIDTSGGIACSRTSGQTPCFIHASASAITCTGTVVDTDGNVLAAHSVVPYEDLEFSWTCGDLAGTETFTNPVTGLSVNANSDQTGPEAVYVYRSAGTYTITLTIRGKNGSGFTTATVTQDITVTAFNASGGELYFDSVGGSDSNNGLSTGAPKQSVSAINTAAQTINRKLHLKRGSAWVGTAGIALTTVGGSNLRFDAYGSGANPIIELNSGSNACFDWAVNGSGTFTKGDVVPSNIDFKRSGNKTGRIASIIISDLNATFGDFYFDNCNFISDLSSTAGSSTVGVEFLISGGLTPTNANFGIWGGSIAVTPTDAGEGIGFLGGLREWNFFVGVTINGAGSTPDQSRDHHIYPDFQNHGLFRWINFGDGLRRTYCINCNWDDTITGGLEFAQYHLIADCNITGTAFAHDGSDALGNTAKVRFKNFVVERNAIHDLRDGGCLFFNIISGTWRDNRVWNVPDQLVSPGTHIQADLGDLIKTRIYRNYDYRISSSNSYCVYEFSLGPAGTYTTPQQITDNITYDTLAQSACVGLVVADHQAAGTFIDRNQYWVPNDSDAKAWFDGSSTSPTAKTFAQWQAFGFDVNGSVADPVWLGPANGDFTPFRRRVRLTAAA